MKLAKTATITSTTITTSPAIAPLFAFSASQTSLAGVMVGGTGVADKVVSVILPLLAPVPDARVEQAVQQIDRQIGRHDQCGDHQHAALQRRIVAAADGFHQPLAD